MSKAERRKDLPNWVLKLPWHRCGDAEEGSNEEADCVTASLFSRAQSPCQSDKAEYIYRWNHEVMRAERILAGDAAGNLPELALQTNYHHEKMKMQSLTLHLSMTARLWPCSTSPMQMSEHTWESVGLQRIFGPSCSRPCTQSQRKRLPGTTAGS